MKIKIFYAWQSDSPSQTNRNFIQEAAELAIERIKSDDKLEIEPAIDRDTFGVPGSPAIAQSILEKIDRCSLFLCDVTIVTPAGVKRPMPNPNVLIELGYATARIGWERIICVMNQVGGGPTKLPFDLQHRRWPIQYRLSGDTPEEKRHEERERLSENIEHAIRAAKESGILISTINPKDRRVAIKFEHSLNEFTGILGAFLHECGYENGTAVFLENYDNEPGTLFPSPTVVEPIVTVCAQNSFESPSNLQVGEHKLTWAEAFAYTLRLVTQQCDRIIDKYADRDDSLISLVDEVQERAHILAFGIEVSLNRPELVPLRLYEKGVPDQHIDWFRYFFLTLLKSYRVIRQFREV